MARMLWTQFFIPGSLEEALELKARLGPAARFVAGGTDLVIDLDRGRQTPCALIDLSRISELNFIRKEGEGLRLGGGVTHAQVLQNSWVKEEAGVLAQACIEVGAPQVRNRSTLAGNIVTASPAADTVPPLLALSARVELESLRGIREIPLTAFLTGFRKVDLADDEILKSIFIPGALGKRTGAFLKLGLRNAQAISVVCVAAVLDRNEAGEILQARIALGSVAPTTIRVPEAEALLSGKILDAPLIKAASEIAMETSTPIKDVRGGAEYRRAMVKEFTSRALTFAWEGRVPPASADPEIFLQVPGFSSSPSQPQSQNGEDLNYKSISLEINGKQQELKNAGDKLLLYALRDAGFTGTKEGCLEGECGACTVWLNGKAVDSCLVPAPSAGGAKITTIEGLEQGTTLHPLQQSFIEQGGVQCGYCTPGLIMAGGALLAEKPGGLNEWECRSALVGNLCRCTGYGRVLAAMDQAQGREAKFEPGKR